MSCVTGVAREALMVVLTLTIEPEDHTRYAIISYPVFSGRSAG